MKTVGANEARTHLATLLELVAAGETITITRRGLAVAILAPAGPTARLSPAEAVEQMKLSRKGRFLSGLVVRELISEGRRF
ncbi:MAG: type II toxin-antitoxin system Phd/YefM family antitoxin [Vulcanimicrobiota bacterium]